MYEGKGPSAWRGRRLSPLIREPICVIRKSFSGSPINRPIPPVERLNSPPIVADCRRGWLGAGVWLGLKPLTRAFPRGAAWGLALLALGVGRCCRPVRLADIPAIYFSPPNRTNLIRLSSSRIRPQRQAAPVGHGGRPRLATLPLHNLALVPFVFFPLGPCRPWPRLTMSPRQPPCPFRLVWVGLPPCRGGPYRRSEGWGLSPYALPPGM
jgi:hypothetical protein